ncbi:MAG: hypothetical protein MUD08_07515 [Cytophagales bacterium]|jgi:hypothetical protein|nr:hypothetical protein [Cytophagales bacterium]
MKPTFFTYIIFLLFAATAFSQTPRSDKHPHGFTQGRQANRPARPVTATSNGSVYLKRNYKNPQTDVGDQVTVAVPVSRPTHTPNPLANPDNYKRQNRLPKTVPKPKTEEVWAEDSVRSRQ